MKVRKIDKKTITGTYKEFIQASAESKETVCIQYVSTTKDS